jgi:hypothetical protein
MDEGTRPYIDKYGVTYKFRPADQVYLRSASTGAQEGPYRISEPKDGRYALSDDEGNKVLGGQLFEEGDLTLYDPFR